MKHQHQNELKANQSELTADLFPVVWKFKLRAFEIDSNKSVVQTKLLNSLAYRLGKETNSTWCNSSGLLVTDLIGSLPSSLLDDLWKDSQNRFGDVISIREITVWRQEPSHVADMANAKFKQIRIHLNRKLESKKFGDAIVKRTCYSQGIVVDGIPFLAISLSSSINYSLSLAQTKAKRTKLELLGLQVKDRVTGWPVGEIVEIIGNLDSPQKSRLLGLAKNQKHRKLIENAPAETDVLKVKTKNGILLDYISSSLIPIPSYGALSDLGLNQNQISNYQRITASERRRLILNLIEQSQLNRLLGSPLDSTNAECFFDAEALEYDGMVKFGGENLGHISQNIRNLKKHGFYSVSERFKENPSINIGVLNGVVGLDVQSFLDALQREISQFGFECDWVNSVSCDAHKFAELEAGIGKLMIDQPHLILSIIPNRFFKESGRVGGPYQDTKNLTINRGTMNQVVSESTVRDPRFKIGNLAVGILSKLGNIPWVLNSNLPFCDRILGADISRQKKENKKGTRNEIGIPRWYKSNGEFLNYRLSNSPIDGERIPFRIIREITPVESFHNQRILFHGDGKRSPTEVEDFLSRGEELEGEIMVVEVIKQSPMRLYSNIDTIGNPKKGSGIRISDTEAVVISTLAQHNTGTPHPLHIRCTPNISIEDAIISVLRLSDLHYGSKQQPRCPITTHDAHHISKMLMMGVRPPQDEGNFPWWL